LYSAKSHSSYHSGTRLGLVHDVLAVSTRYTVTVWEGSNLLGEPLENAPYTWTFTTGLTTTLEIDLALDKQRVGLGDVVAGDVIEYSFEVANSGPCTSTTLTLVDEFSDTLALAAVSGTGCYWSLGSAIVTCTVTISGTGTTQVLLDVTTNADYRGLLSNQAYLELAEGTLDPNPLDNEAGPVVVKLVARPVHHIYLPLVLRQA
jgi:uncharacterized repeat protein (TIGR01451 family)